MIARVPQLCVSSAKTLASLQHFLEESDPIDLAEQVTSQIFDVTNIGSGKECSYLASITSLAAIATESFLGILQYGDIQSVEEYFAMLKKRINKFGGGAISQDQLTLGQAVLSGYIQSSLSLCQVYNWVSRHNVGNDVLQTIFCYVCELLAYAAGSKQICQDLLAIMGVVVTHWKADLADVNYARLYIITLVAKFFGTLKVNPWISCELHNLHGATQSGDKSCWLAVLASSVRSNNSTDFKDILQSVSGYIWDSSIDLLKDAKVKRRICERARSIKISAILTTKEVNRLAVEELHSVLTDLLTVCRIAMSSVNSSSATSEETSRTAMFGNTPGVSSNVVSLLGVAVHAVKSSAEQRISELENELNNLRIENTELRKTCKSLRSEVNTLKSINKWMFQYILMKLLINYEQS